MSPALILFVDGVDGSGKSTLVDGLLDLLVAQGTPAVHAPPLWTYLTALGSPDDFAGWVLRTPGVEVARQLLSAMSRRVDTLRASLAQGRAATGAVVVADRGPKTVVCSALAHASTGRAAESATPTGPTVADCVSALEGRVMCLAANATVAAVELLHRDLHVVLNRLAPLEAVSPAYERYLRAFSDEMTTAAAWPGVPWMAIPADAEVASNVASVEAWVNRMRAC
jgi:hypothetical protein